MQPDSTEEEPNNYDFLDDSKQSPKNSFLLGLSLKKRLIVVSLGGIGLLVVFWMVFGLIFGGAGRTTELLVKVAQRQTELIRLSDIGAKNASSESASALATNTKLSVQTTLVEVNQMLKTRERSLGTAERRALQSTEINEQLEEAIRAGGFDEVFMQILQDNLRAYQDELDTAHRALSSEEERQILEEAYEATKILLQP